jgi:YHS domain-containing protein
MKHGICTLTLSVAVLVLASPVIGGGKAQSTCPVSGETIDRATSPHLDWEGQRIYFCCNNCPAKFKADPEKYFARIAADGVELENVQTTCPVSGEEFGGDMGEPVPVAYKGRTVKLCCKMCKAKFDKDPAKYLARLPGEQGRKE